VVDAPDEVAQVIVMVRQQAHIRTTASPAEANNRSKRPETCRQSSIAHTRPVPSEIRRAHERASTTPALVDANRTRPDPPPVASSTATSVCDDFVCIRSDHDHVHRSSIAVVARADLRRSHLSRGDATLLSRHAVILGAATDDNACRSHLTADSDPKSQSVADPRSQHRRSAETAPTPRLSH
jgi:hypothetical protein